MNIYKKTPLKVLHILILFSLFIGGNFSPVLAEMAAAPGTITIQSQSDPAGGYNFQFGGDLGEFSLDDGEAQTFENLAAGKIAIQEKIAEGWVLTQVRCGEGETEPSPVEISILDERLMGIELELAPGQHIVCTFEHAGGEPFPEQSTPDSAGGATIAWLANMPLSPTANLIPVNTAEDELDGSCADGDCSLRDAILTAQDGDILEIPSGTYTLRMGHLAIDKNLTLSGAGADTTIIQAAEQPNVANWSVIQVHQPNAAITVIISGLTLRHGGTQDDVDGKGGGLQNFGENLILDNSKVAFNSAYFFGGGVLNDSGTMLIRNSTLYANTVGSDASGSGGGIYNNGFMTIVNSTISGNQVLAFDGEIYDTYGGGGIENAISGRLSLEHVTISGNLSYTPGGGIFNTGVVTATNSLIAGNSSRYQASPSLDCYGTFVSGGYNLIGDATGCTGFTDGVNNDQVGVDPLLASLADNGGTTLTRALYGGSPAIDAIPNGTNGCFITYTVDQRGVTRPQGSGCDIGAFETELPAPTVPAPNPVSINTTEDELDGSCEDGDCSLRDAILTAQDGDTLVVPAGTYTLRLGHLALDNNITLNGAGADTTIIQTATQPNIAHWPVISIYQPNDAITVTLSGLTLRHGGSQDDVDLEGGGLQNFGENLILESSSVTYNAAYEFGGGIRNYSGTMLIRNSTISANTVGSDYSGSGGGIYNNGVMTITNSTISGNQLLSFDGDNTISTGGGAIQNFDSGRLFLEHVTISGNLSYTPGGGIFNTGVVTATNSLIAGNSSRYQASPSPDCFGTFVSGGYNLIGDATGCTGFTDGVNNDQVGSDPLVAPLADNGGTTLTRALYEGSPAIDAIPNGTNGCSTLYTVDQRGMTRPQGPGCDIGAFETETPAPAAPAPNPVSINTTEDEFDGSCEDGDCSLRDAILTAQDGDTLVVPAGTYTLRMGHLAIDNDLTLSGAGADTTIIQPAEQPNIANWPVIQVYQPNEAITVTLSGLTLRYGGTQDDVDGEGGGLQNFGENLILDSSTVAFNSAYKYGGGIRNDSGTMLIRNSTIYANTVGNANGGGGGIYNGGVMTITNSTISGNQVLSFAGQTTTSSGGGGIQNNNLLKLEHVTISSNISADPGGGIFNTGVVTATNSLISGNTSRYQAVPSPDCYGTFDSGGYNLIGDATGCTGFTDGVNNDQVGSDPLLAPLADNGGPTLTHALYVSSPAFNAIPSGANGCSSTYTADQRGVTRPQGFGCDIGAFELEYDPVLEIAVDEAAPLPGQTVTVTITLTNNGPDLTGGVISGSLSTGLNFLGPITLAPSDAGLAGTNLPVVASDLVISYTHQITATFPVTVSDGLAADTDLVITAWFSSTEVSTPVQTEITLTVLWEYIYLPLVHR